MAKQQFTLALDEYQVRQAIEAYVAGMVDTQAYDVDVAIKGGQAQVRVTKKRARKAKPIAAKPEVAIHVPKERAA